jgi:hypothetical protein
MNNNTDSPALALAISGSNVFLNSSCFSKSALAGRTAVLRNVIPMVPMKTRTRCGLRLTPVKCSIRAAASLADVIEIH